MSVKTLVADLLAVENRLIYRLHEMLMHVIMCSMAHPVALPVNKDEDHPRVIALKDAIGALERELFSGELQKKRRKEIINNLVQLDHVLALLLVETKKESTCTDEYVDGVSLSKLVDPNGVNHTGVSGHSVNPVDKNDD